MRHSVRIASALAGVATLALYPAFDSWGAMPAAERGAGKPNILFIVMDDVGVDQLGTYGFGGLQPPRTPNIDTIAANGVLFTNAWAMPECSPSRAAFFTGRYPVRTGVNAAIVGNHLPQDYISSFESTLPRVLETAGYKSALIGKYHLGNEKDPAGNCAASTRGWTHFSGNITPGPPSIDMTAGGYDPAGGQVCGYFQGPTPGACYTLTKSGSLSCRVVDHAGSDPGTSPARTCLQHGGLFRPGQACGGSAPTQADFDVDNAYYVWPRIAEKGVRPSTSVDQCGKVTTVRTHMNIAQSEESVDWWNRQSGPRMLTLSFNDMHTPLQKVATTLVPDPKNQPSACGSGPLPQRTLLNNMIEGIDAAIGKALAEMGLATLRPDGRTIRSLDLKDTMVVIVGDNGSFGSTVRLEDGFSAGRAKASVYQTGIWVPLIVAGPVVEKPGRTVDALVNFVDLFHLFGAVAGVNVEEVVPPTRALDAMPMLPYLTSAKARSIRKTNFTQTGAGTFTPDPSERSWPCAIGASCNDTQVNSQSLCNDNGGVWYGPGATVQLSSCCAVVAQNPGANMSIISPEQYAVGDKRYKLVELWKTDCSKPLPPGAKGAFPWAEYETTQVRELYDIRKTAANPLGLDNADDNFLKNCPEGTDPRDCLSGKRRRQYDRLAAELDRIKASAEPQSRCEAMGDGNLDLRVNRLDVRNWRIFKGRGPSRYDINMDGETDKLDRDIIKANLGESCLGLCERADLDRDGRVDEKDMSILRASAQGKSCDQALCNGDLNGNGKVDRIDARLMVRAKRTCGRQSASALN